MPATLSSQTISDALHTATVMLERSSGSPRLDAELLLEHVMGLTRTSFRASPERELPAAAGWSFQQLVKRRMQGEPIAYIRGHQEFWSLLFEVNSDVLIPRPETELLVERALDHIGDQQHARVADLGTGSGAVGLSVAHERPTIVMHATDVSPRALDVAARNAARLNIRNVKFAQADWFAGLADAQFDLMVSNPPYIAENDPDLHPQVRKHEPIGALISGRTGLEAIEQIIANAGRHLVSEGWLALEHGWKQAPAVRNLLVRHGFTHVRSHADLSGHERVTEGQKSIADRR